MEESHCFIHLQVVCGFFIFGKKNSCPYERLWYLIRSKKGTELKCFPCKYIALLNLFPGEPEGYQHRIGVVASTASVQKDRSKFVIEIDIVLQGASIFHNI